MNDEQAIAEITERIHSVVFIGNRELCSKLVRRHLSDACDPNRSREERAEAWLSIATIAAKQASR